MLCVSKFIFLLPTSIPLYEYATLHISTHLCVWVVSCSWLSPGEAALNFYKRVLCGHVVSFLSVIYPGGELPGPMVGVYVTS